MQQLLVHILGDYWLQSDWMAMNKSKRTIPCLVHVLIYTATFLLLTQSWKALLFIGATHFLIDRYPIILKRFIWLKNHMGYQFAYPPFHRCEVTGYYDDLVTDNRNRTYFCGEGREQERFDPRHGFITAWLYIITDNSLHLACNWFALSYLT